MNLNDLPVEMLCTIFDHLDLYELKLASLVCRRWSELTFSGRRMDRVQLELRNCDNPNDFLQSSKRSHRNVSLRDDFPIDQLESLVRLLHTIKLHVRTLDIYCAVTWDQLGSILSEAPKLQNLSINYNIFQEYGENNTPFRLLPKLKSLNRRQLFSFFRTNIPNLQCLEMNCKTDFELDVWKILSGKLKLVHVYDLRRRYLHLFLELTFPRLEDLLINMHDLNMNEWMNLERSYDFFRRHPFLRELSFFLLISAELVEIITRHCPELTYLHLVLNREEATDLESLVQLTKLKHLSLGGIGNRKILRGALKSLESVTLEMPFQVLLENVFEVVPRLSCLRITELMSCDELQFICEKFSYLRRLELSIYLDEGTPVSVADDSVRFDRLEHLQELELSGNIKIRSIHRNNVRCLTIFDAKIPNDELDQIADKFPFLTRLILDDCSVSVADVERLHKLMPSCNIDYDFGKKRFYPIDNVSED